MKLESKPNLTGTTCSSLLYTEDFLPPNERSISPSKISKFFVFPDLMIHRKGRYMFHFELVYFVPG